MSPSLAELPIMQDATYYLSYADYARRYASWWWGQYQMTAIALGVGGVAALAGLRLAWNHLTTPTHADTWGSARWARASEIAAEGLFHEGPGIILGRYGPWWHRRTLCSDADTHVGVFGPTRQLKTWSLIIPSLLNWQGSVLVLDIKGELYDLTSGWRACLGPVFRFNPTEATTHAINPWAFIREASEVADAQALADQVTADPDATPDQKSEYWRDQVADWLVTLFLYVRRQVTYPRNFAGILAYLRASTNRRATLQTMGACAEPEVQAGARRLLGITAPGRLDEIWDGAIRVLALWRDPGVAHATRQMDVPVDTFQQLDYPVSLYLQVTAQDLSGRLRPLFRLILDQFVARLMARKTTDYRQPLLIVLDEVASLGYMKVVEDVCSLLAGYGIRVILAFQSLNQLWKHYTRHTGILDNLGIRVIYEPSNPETAASLQALLGDATVTDVSERKSGHRFGLIYDDEGVSVQTHHRGLLTTEELMRLGKYAEIIRVSGTATGLPPIRAQKLAYRDREFRGKLLPAVS